MSGIHELWPILYRSSGTRMLVDKKIILAIVNLIAYKTF